MEVSIVILILGITAALAAPRVQGSIEHHHVESAARRVAADLAMAQRAAKTASAERTVAYDVPADSYLVFPDVPRLDRRDLPYEVDLATHPYGASLVSADFSGNPYVVFNGFGVPASAGQVVVRSGSLQRTVTLSLDGATEVGP